MSGWGDSDTAGPTRAVPDPVPLGLLRVLRDGRTITLNLDGALDHRIRAQINRVDLATPGLGREPGESLDDSMRIAVLALLDRGLTEDEADAGLIYDWSVGHLVHRRRVALRLRLRRAYTALRYGS